MITEQTKSLLLQVVGFLRLIEDGFRPSSQEAKELQDKIGSLIDRESGA